MIGRIVEIAQDSRSLSLYRGFLIIRGKKEEIWEEIGRIPLDDILAVICNSHGITCTNNLLVELAERNIPFVLCGDNHLPVGILWPIEGHHLQARRFEAQIEASLPMRKRLWAGVVKAKILAQNQVLAAFGRESLALSRLANRVKSGDSENNEAQAARIYWKLLFGEGFIRDQNATGINACLNYGYAIVRSAIARAVIAAGLHPSIGLHHKNDADTMRLVDDLMEPFRPLVDYVVKQSVANNRESIEVDASFKKAVVEILFFDVITAQGRTSVLTSMNDLTSSLSQVLLKEQKDLKLPQSFVLRQIQNPTAE